MAPMNHAMTCGYNEYLLQDEQLVQELNDQISSLQDNIAYVQENISECQSNIMQMEESKVTSPLSLASDLADNLLIIAHM